MHDLGKLTIDGSEYEVIDVEKVGNCVLHFLDKPLTEEKIHYINQGVTGHIDQWRRSQLRAHHTGTHVIFAACRRVLGPHIWQGGSKNNVTGAHLDITHFPSLSKEQEMEIENAANKIIQAAYP